MSGIAASIAAKLAQLGVARELDLVLHLPLRYEDETRITPIAGAGTGVPVQIEGTVEKVEVAFRPRRQLLVRLRDDTGEAVLRFFNFYGSQQKSLQAAKDSRARVRAFGELRTGFFGGEMIHPRYHLVRAGEALPAALTPVYPSTAGLSQSVLRQAIERTLEKAGLEDTLPQALRQRHGLIDFRQAVLALHHPSAAVDRSLDERTHPAWTRVKFDELLAQQLSMRMHYEERKHRAAAALAPGGGEVARLLEALPFRLTRAQQRAWCEIEQDLSQTHPMHRLLQGDVGSGKTVVAALAALRASQHGFQTAIMAPTEILAEQHYRKFSEWLSPLGVRIAWLTGGQPRKERSASLSALASGETALAIGTHALFQEGVAFHALGLAIVDEQHRFGVAQRLALRGKAAGEPHLLMMSATPIPRTLSMSYYADLDISTIDELPPGRTPVRTKLISYSRRDEVIERIRDACRAGRQAYWVCPLIEESETLELQNAIDTREQLAAELPGLPVGLVHGRLAPAEKAEVMRRFSAGDIRLLVSTTVIEVGVDVANASLMVIDHAERMGLAQLHQLRGRVGRGAEDSVCVLLYAEPLSEGARRRLKVIYENADGFTIAREDLELRGPGELLGARQSGLPLLRFADLVLDAALLGEARAAAAALLAEDPAAARRHVERWLGSRGGFLLA